METLLEDIGNITQDKYFVTGDFWCLEWETGQGCLSNTTLGTYFAVPQQLELASFSSVLLHQQESPTFMRLISGWFSPFPANCFLSIFHEES